MKKIIVFTLFLYSFYSGFSSNELTARDDSTIHKQSFHSGFTLYKAPDSTVFTNEDLKKKEATLINDLQP